MRKVLFLLFALLIADISAWADGVEFTASAPNVVVNGGQFRVSYTVTTQHVKEFRAPTFEGFDVLYGPTRSTQSSTQIINGDITVSSSIIYTFVLQATKEGELKVPGATIVADGKKLTSNALSIKVLPPDQTNQSNQSNQTGQGQQAAGSSRRGASSSSSSGGQISADDLFITATLNKTNVYEQEAVLLTYKVYYAVNLREMEIKMPDLNGFHTQEVKLQREQPTGEYYNGRNYSTIVWSQYVLFPQQSGKLEIPSINFDATVAVRTRRTSMDPLDMFFNGNMGYVDVRKTISSPKLTLNVSPLPSGKPASFSGGVGDFTLQSSISTTELKANEAVTLKLEIAGTGNMKLINTPEVSFPQDFETYDPKVENNFSLTRGGLSGKKVIEYLAIPRHAGTFTIPPVEFSYFDLKTKSYKTLTTGPYELTVAKGEEGAGQVVSTFTNQEDVKLIGQDVRYIKTGAVSLLPNGRRALFGTWAYWLWYIVPLLLSIAFIFVYRKRAVENANVSKVRTKNANKVAVRRLKQASRLMAGQQQEAFYEEVLKASWGYISDKMNIPLSQLSKDNVEQELLSHQVDASLTNEFIRVLNDCEFARYAPASVAGGMEQVYKAAIEVISKMESSIKRKK
ncbi:MAG: protein BatD [Bacteroidaceae bacterium]|nr:protein BatD [Bacteroidaceae bacterium]